MPTLLLVAAMLIAAPPELSLDAAAASRFARLALKCVRQEYPNKPDHVMGGPAEVLPPKAMHPAFYGCYDWHSSVHGHWMLVRLLRKFPELQEAKEIRAVLDANLAESRIAAEVAYFHQPNRKSFERTYGWAWLLELSAELRGWDAPDAKLWALIVERARTYFGKDRAVPIEWEPGGEDFLSPALEEAALMAAVLPAKEFRGWLERFLPKLLASGKLEPAVVSDRTDPKIVHLDGLNLSRARTLSILAAALNDRRSGMLLDLADAHARASLPHIASGSYEGEHWLATFAVQMLDARAKASRP